MRPLVVNLHPEFAHTTHNDKALARNGGCYWISWFEKSKTDPAAAGTVAVIIPVSPPSGPTQRLFHGPPAESKLLPVSQTPSSY